jgi:hypothetical protein
MKIERVQTGFYQVAHARDGPANIFRSVSYNAGAISGTTEAFITLPKRKDSMTRLTQH